MTSMRYYLLMGGLVTPELRPSPVIDLLVADSVGLPPEQIVPFGTQVVITGQLQLTTDQIELILQ